MSQQYTAIDEKEKSQMLSDLKSEYKDLDIKVERLSRELSKDTPTNLLKIMSDKLINNRKNFTRLRKYIMRLSELNYKSGMSDRKIYKKIRQIRRLLQMQQTGDANGVIYNVQPLLSAQVNTKTATLVSQKTQYNSKISNLSRGKKRKKVNKSKKNKSKKHKSKKHKSKKHKSKLKKVKTRSKPKYKKK